MKFHISKLTRNLAILGASLLVAQNSQAFLCLIKNSDRTCPTQSSWSQTPVTQADLDTLNQFGKSSSSQFQMSALHMATMLPGPVAMANLGVNFVSANRSALPLAKLKALNNIAGSLSNLCPPTRILASGATLQIALNSSDISVAKGARDNLTKALLFNLASPMPMHKMPPAIHVIQVGIIGLLTAKINGQNLNASEQLFLSRLNSLKTKPSLEQANELAQIAEELTGIRNGDSQEILARIQDVTGT